MKTYLYPNAYTVILHTPGIYRKVIFLFFLLSVSLIAFSDDNGGSNKSLEFRNAKLESGVAGANGAVYRFPQVGKDIDALIKITDRSSSKVRLVNIDLTNTGWDKAFQPQITCDKGGLLSSDWWMEFEISFVEKGKSDPVDVNSFDITALDIDGDGDKLYEFVSFYKPKSYIMENGSLLTVTNLLQSILGLLTPGKRFDGPTKNFNNIDTSATSVMVTNKYEHTNSFRIRAGAGAVGGGSAAGSDRMFSMYFKSFSYQAPVEFSLPLVLNSFNASLNSKKVMLNWVTGMEKNLSHFVVERSINGREFSDAGVVFATGNSGVKLQYSFTDAANTNTGVVYYRLKMVDEDKKYQYSPIRMIKMNVDENTALQLQAYPNPTVADVRITIPATWQNKPVQYAVYNMSGRLVKQITNNYASQTEVISVRELGAGVYIIKATTGNESAMQRIIRN